MKSNNQTRLCILCCAAALAAPALVPSARAGDTPENPGQLSSSDYKFAKEAACGGMMEVTLGKMAENSKNPAVQQFGQEMVKDHGKAGDDLKSIASRKGAELPTALTDKEQKEVDHLASLTGPEFDKAYISMMVKDHKTDAKEFKKASEDTQDPDLKVFAANTLTVVQDHLKMAEDIQKNLKAESSSSP